MSEEWKKRINEIDKRIEDLQNHSIMWSRAGGVGGRMAMQANSEISTLKKEKERLVKQVELEKEDKTNGTNKLNIFLIQCKIEDLQEMKKQAKFIKKIKLKSQIFQEEQNLKNIEKYVKK